MVADRRRSARAVGQEFKLVDKAELRNALGFLDQEETKFDELHLEAMEAIPMPVSPTPEPDTNDTSDCAHGHGRFGDFT